MMDFKVYNEDAHLLAAASLIMPSTVWLFTLKVIFIGCELYI